MGLDASVMCNCYPQGKAKPCPFPSDFYVDQDGFPAVRLSGKDETTDNEKSEAFDTWLADCCEHPYMDYATVYIPNWKSYRAFVDALAGIGWEHFPTLQRELPSGNQGTTPAEASAKALQELDHFKAQDGVTQTFLVNTQNGAIIGASARANDDLFTWDGRTGMRLGFDDNGFFIRDSWELNRELFRATRFQQRVMASEELDKADEYEFIDLDSDRRFVCPTPVRIFLRDERGQLKQDYPTDMQVEKRTVDVNFFRYVLDPLTSIFQVSVETGNPVRWS
jgi:hypothetical protein